MYAFLIGSLWLLAIWLLIFSLRPSLRKEMFWVSFWTAFLGLTEPLFVPEYWNPPTLFNLAQKTGFDIESIIFAFSVGGIAAVIYELIFPVRHEPVSRKEKYKPRHKYHPLALLSVPIIFLLLFIFTNLNPIYSTVIALISGGLATWYCRPDLKKKMFASAFIFLGLYFFFFLVLILFYPGYVQKVWNLSAISGILILGIPLEELIFAFSLGFLWSSVYEHIMWRKIKQL